ATGGSYSLTGAARNTTYASSTYSGMASAAYVVAGGSTCTRANPVVTMSPSQSQSVAPGTPVAFAVSVTDNDSSACTTANFNLNANLPSGWVGMWSSSALSLSPGASSSAS